ncbi:50S ribosomal protein L5 [Candidatus Vidania fulgoroideorum]
MKKYISRYKLFYFKRIIPFFMSKIKYKNPMCIPKIKKIVISYCFNSFNNDYIKKCINEFILITGQYPVICKTKKSISNFNTKINSPIGLKITLRNNKMYDFLDKLLNIYILNLKDFKGFSLKSFDKKGNFNLGFNDMSIFFELLNSKKIYSKGFNISLNIKSLNLNESIKLLKLFNFKFIENV